MNIILGTMTFGPQVDYVEGKEMVQMFSEYGHSEIDTSYVYNEGKTECMIGKIQSELPDRHFSFATKVHPRITGKMDGKAVEDQLNESLDRLQTSAVDILYFHFPDPNTPVEEALEMCAKLHDLKKIKEFGLSNYPGWMVVDIWHKCRQRGWPVPSVYQGMYNCLTRGVEKELFPVLRNFGIRFYAFNPLAGGILSGKYRSYEDDPNAGRFTERPNYKSRYWKKSFFSAVEILSKECKRCDISLVEATLRWLAFHSNLDVKKGDGIVVGASSSAQLEQNIRSLQGGELPAPLVSTFNSAWEIVCADSPDYFRFYNS